MAQNSQRSAKKHRRGPGRPFTKGRSPNPGGRPKAQVSVTAILRKKIEARKGTRLRAEAIAGKLLELAESGDIRALTYLIDRLDGKAQETFNVAGEIGLNLKDAAEVALTRKMIGWIRKNHTEEEVRECLATCGIER